MQHDWNKETNTCRRCGLVKATKKRKELINTRYPTTYDQYYTVYYHNGLTLFSAPKCFDPQQKTLDL